MGGTVHNLVLPYWHNTERRFISGLGAVLPSETNILLHEELGYFDLVDRQGSKNTQSVCLAKKGTSRAKLIIFFFVFSEFIQQLEQSINRTERKLTNLFPTVKVCFIIFLFFFSASLLEIAPVLVMWPKILEFMNNSDSKVPDPHGYCRKQAQIPSSTHMFRRYIQGLCC